MEFFEKIKLIITDPDRFFDKIKNEKNLKSAFAFLLATSLVSLIATSILVSSSPVNMAGELGIIQIVIFAWVIKILISFVLAYVIQFVATRLNGKGKYDSAYKAVAYGSLPSEILGWIPFIGFAFSLWSLYLQTKGVSKLYKISMPRAFIAVISPSILIVTLILIMILTLFHGLY